MKLIVIQPIHKRFLLVLLSLVLVLWHVPTAVASSFRTEVEPGRQECFYTDVEAGKLLLVDYVVLSATQGELDIDFELSGPPGQPPVIERRKMSSRHRFTEYLYDTFIYATSKYSIGRHPNPIRYPAIAPGSYKVCFGNTFSHFSKKTVSFSVKVEKGGHDSLWNNYNVNELAPEEEETVKIEDFHERTDKVRKLLTSVVEIQEEFRQMELRDRSTAEHNFERVNFWSTLYLAVLISVGIIQVMLVKGFFDEKYAFGRFIHYLLGDL